MSSRRDAMTAPCSGSITLALAQTSVRAPARTQLGPGVGRSPRSPEIGGLAADTFRIMGRYLPVGDGGDQGTDGGGKVGGDVLAGAIGAVSPGFRRMSRRSRLAPGRSFSPSYSTTARHSPNRRPASGSGTARVLREQRTPWHGKEGVDGERFAAIVVPCVKSTNHAFCFDAFCWDRERRRDRRNWHGPARGATTPPARSVRNTPVYSRAHCCGLRPSWRSWPRFLKGDDTRNTK